MSKRVSTCLVRRRPALLRRQRVALLAHQASIDAGYTHATTLLRDLRAVKLVALLAPEHGLWGAPQDHARIAGARDPATSLPVWSLYGARLEPTAAMLRGVDTVVIDLQDVGSRYYTFVWTTALAMRVCARMGVRVVVLDRPNPLGGARVEGNVADPAFASFVGLYPLAIRHGMTLGELAVYLNEQHAIGCHLTVVPMRGWRRAMLWEDTGLPWVAPSPNMPTPDTARVYSGAASSRARTCRRAGAPRVRSSGSAPPTSTRNDTRRRSSASGSPASGFVPRASCRRFRSGPGGSARASRFT
mgnify:CR=1 FL=1